ncbi:hypothetical protein EYB26_001889 [Talaromyces marneffei]|nr:uncharacterized protein EYB26_001889 [Talaromyces marneffei]QGA14236.1 hypothetical protein EYB26_001889 [Talaromyces marneffei]
MFEISVRPDHQNGAGRTHIITLPLNLIAHIVSWIEDPGDLARMCRTCRLLHYMAIPHLYRNISLTSYDRIRYRDELPEGWGNASPFSMGLNTLVTRSHASLVQSMTLRGEWNEPELEEHSRVGRVPDSSMMLNISVRAALDRMKNIESFSWELNTKLMETVYLGLPKLPKLTSLSIRFPSSRHPRPIYVIPAMPHLRILKVTDIDPVCYPDDIATLLSKSPHLEDLKMHWSPRMRENQEPSVVLHDYFRHCIRDKTPLKLKKVAFHNLFSRHTSDWQETSDDSILEELTFLNGYTEDSPAHSTFVDKTWSTARMQISEMSNLKLIRHDLVSKEFCEFLSCSRGLEKLYCVNSARPIGSRPSMRSSASNTTTHSYLGSNGIGPNGTFPSIAGNGSMTSPSSPRSPAFNTTQHLQLRDSYFNSVMANHGATLRHLILPSRWPLSSTTLARLVHVCPNLEQVAFALEVSTMDAFGLLIPFLRKLQAMRILIPSTEKPAQEQAIVQTNPNSPIPPFSSMYEMVELDDDIHTEKLSAVTADRDRGRSLKVIGMGWKAWELGDFYYIPASSHTPTASGADSYRPVDDARPMINTTSNGRGSPTPGFSATEPARKSQLHPTNTRTPIPYVTKTPKSSLGKRARDDMSPPLDSSSKPSLVLDSDNVYDTLPTGEKIIWRRRVRPVGWDVLKKWEIWALDSQDV